MVIRGVQQIQTVINLLRIWNVQVKKKFYFELGLINTLNRHLVSAAVLQKDAFGQLNSPLIFTMDQVLCLLFRPVFQDFFSVWCVEFCQRLLLMITFGNNLSHIRFKLLCLLSGLVEHILFYFHGAVFICNLNLNDWFCSCGHNLPSFLRLRVDVVHAPIIILVRY